MEFSKELTYKELSDRLNELASTHPCMEMSYLGESLLSKPIPMITLGEREAKKSVLYVSTHHATENICTSVLLNFIEEYISAYESYKQIYGINMRYLHKMRKIYIAPMLNPDGVEYRLEGLKETNPIKDRVLAYNGDSDFSKWNANARGVDLNHNYDAYFKEYKEIEKRERITNGRTKYSGEFAESEPEISALTTFIRYNSEQIEGILTLHTQGEEIYYKTRGMCPEKSEHIGKIISRMTGYALSEAEGTASYGGLTDWYINEYAKPSFTIECGRGENPLPPSQIITIYSRLKETLFTFPILF